MRSLMLVLGVAGCSVLVFAQQIVIEPTNGRATSSSSQGSHARVIELAPAPKSSEVKPAQPRASAKPVTKSTVKHQPSKQPVAKVTTLAAPIGETAKNEPAAIAQPTAPAKKQFPSRPAWAMSDTRDAQSLRSEISNALARDPKLKDSFIQVKVDDEEVTLEGRAAGTEERLQAERLAQSYAWNRKLVDHLEIAPKISAQR
jgi:hypothetical protein